VSGAPRHVVVAGRDAALWLSVMAIARALKPAGVSVTAVELPTALSPASVYTGLPALEALHAKLGLDEAALLRATQGSFSLGWNVAADVPFFLAHGAYGAPIDGTPFFPYWAKARQFGLGAALEDFCPTAMAARHGRILLPDDETAAFGRTDYGYHLPAMAYVAALKSRAARLGITMVRTRDVAVEREGADGTITALTINGGDRVAGDLFIDASGVETVLVEGSHDAASGFAVDRRVVANAPPFSSIPAYTELRVGEAGWAALHAHQGGVGVTYAFASALQSDGVAVVAAAELSGLQLADIAIEAVSHRVSAQAWQANHIAIGATAGAFDPLFGLDLYAIQLGIVHLLSLFPVSADFAAERAEYNRITRSAFDRLRDFQSAFYVANTFPGAFWDHARAAPVSDTVTHKIATYRARGTIAPMEDETFAADLWQAMFAGLGVMPESWPPAIDRTPPDRIKAEFRRILGFVKSKVLEQPTHDQYLRSLCGREAA
jgi:tryptophan 7-halogenase